MSDLKGKKLLLLGGHALMCHVIDKARELGVYTIVTDYVPNAPAKEKADEAYDISTLDVEALIKLAKDKKVDGVFTGYVDINLVPCCKVCDALGLPFYATLEQIDQTMNKNHYKALCRKHGIRVVDDVDVELCKQEPDNIQYPVIVKPADSYSSKGISVCYESKDLKTCINTAMDVSTCKEVVVEKYMDAEDVYLYFTVQNGIVSLSAMADRLLNDEQKGYAPQPVGYFFPSKYLSLYYEQVEKKLQCMMDDIGFKNGSFFMQGFVENEEIIFFEMGLRLSGGAGYLQIRHQNEIDQIEMHIRYALTGVFGNWDLQTYDNPKFHRPSCVVVILLKDGTITSIHGLEKVKALPEVFDILQMHFEGDVMKDKGTLNQVFARIYMCAENEEKLKKAIDFIKANLVIYDENNNNMIMNLFDPAQAL